MRWRGKVRCDGGQNLGIVPRRPVSAHHPNHAMLLKSLLSLFPVASPAGQTSAAPASSRAEVKVVRHNEKPRDFRDSLQFASDLMPADVVPSELDVASGPAPLQGVSDIPLIGTLAQRAASRPTGIEQLAYHCGDVALQNAALAELLRIDPKNPLVHESVRAYIFEMGQHEFFAKGWRKANRLSLNPNDILHDLHVDFEARRLQLLMRAESAPIERKKVRRFFFKTVRYTWMGRTFDTLEVATAAKRAECLRLTRCVMGDRLEPRHARSRIPAHAAVH